MPAIAYLLDMYHRTEGAYGINEVILTSAIAAIVFPLFSVQPLTFVGITGLINLVNYTQYDIVVKSYGLSQFDYLRVQAWSLIWSAAFHFLTSIFNLNDLVRFITDMTTETFGFYVGIVYIQKGIELLILEFEPLPLDNATGWLSVTIAILFTVSVHLVTSISKYDYLPFQLRRFVSAFAFPVGILFWTGFSNFPENSLRKVKLERVPITAAWKPTLQRESWLIDFWNLEARWVLVALPFGILITILFWFDHNVSAVMAQARQFPVKRPSGFHWDFFLLGITTFISGILGLPAPNGLVPQCPWSTESLSVLKQQDNLSTNMEISETTEVEHYVNRDPEIQNSTGLSATTSSQNAAFAPDLPNPAAIPPPEIINERIVEQRIGFLLVGLLTMATMTRPFLIALGTIPRAVFAGVFIDVGWMSIEQNSITRRTLSLFRDPISVKFIRHCQSRYEDKEVQKRGKLYRIRRKKVAIFVAIQWLFFAMTMAISQTIAAIGFPVIIILLIPTRMFVLPYLFAEEELSILDAPTADADVVWESIGSRPLKPLAV